MNELHIKVGFYKHTTVYLQNTSIVEGDYNTTKLVFEFEEDVSDGRVLFKMSNPNGEVVLLQELNDSNEVVLVGYDENGVAGSLFSIYGLYPFELAWYFKGSEDGGKLTSAPGWLNVSKRQVAVEENTLRQYLPWLDRLAEINHSVFIRYSIHPDGTDFTETWTRGQNYIGVATGKVASENKADYDWLYLSSPEATDINGLDLAYLSPFVNPQAGINGYKIERITYGADLTSFTDVVPTKDTNYTYAKLYLNRKMEEQYAVGDIIQIDLKSHFYDVYKVVSIETEGDKDCITVTRVDGSYVDTNFEVEPEDDNYLENWCYVIGKSHGDFVKPTLGAVAGGEDTVVTGRGAAGFGRGLRILGAYGFGAGRDNTAGYGASVFGRGNTALGSVSYIAGGYKNIISDKGTYSYIAGGQQNEIHAPHSAILGSFCKIPAGLNLVRLLGYGLQASKDNQTLFGRWNAIDEDKYFELLCGIGKSANERANGIGMSWNGNFYVKGDVYVGGVSKDNTTKLATLEEVQALISYKTITVSAKISSASPLYFGMANTITVTATFSKKAKSATCKGQAMTLAEDGKSATYTETLTLADMKTDSLSYSITVTEADTQGKSASTTAKASTIRAFYYGGTTQYSGNTELASGSHAKVVAGKLTAAEETSLPTKLTITPQSGDYIWVISPWQISKFMSGDDNLKIDAPHTEFIRPADPNTEGDTGGLYAFTLTEGRGVDSFYVYKLTNKSNGSTVNIYPIE